MVSEPKGCRRHAGDLHHSGEDCAEETVDVLKLRQPFDGLVQQLVRNLKL